MYSLQYSDFSNAFTMAEGNRSLRSFIHDPKHSVMNYIADNISADRIAAAQSRPSSAGHPMTTNAQNTPSQYGSAAFSNAPNMPPSYSAPDSHYRPHVAENVTQQQPVQYPQQGLSGDQMQSGQSQPFGEQNQGHQDFSASQSSLSASMGGHVLHALNHVPNPKLVETATLSEQHALHPASGSMVQSSNPARSHSLEITRLLEEALTSEPPAPGTRHRDGEHSASRVYHRLVLEFEATKLAFLNSKASK